MFGVIMRGIRHRPGRSLIVMMLAVCATAAAVMLPAYTAAARHSLLLDELRRLPPAAVGLRLAGAVDADTDAAALLAVVDEAVNADADLAPFGSPVTFTHGEALLVGADHPTGATVAHRDDVCRHVVMIAGDCRTRHSELLISKRSAEEIGVDVGDALTLTGVTESTAGWTATVVGVYLPADPDEGYWGQTPYFRHGSAVNDVQRLDALLVTNPDQVTVIGGDRDVGVEYRLDIDGISLDTVDAVAAAVSRIDGAGGVGNPRLGPAMIPLDVRSSLPGVVDRVAAEQAAVARAVPVVAVPLLLLCWFVLYLVAARLTSERAEQIGLAKLRGHRLPAVALVGSGEAVVLIVAALPLGMLAGLGGVALLRDATLAPGSAIDAGMGLAWSALAALVGALSAVVVGALPVLDLPVVRLLRRVRRGRRLSAGTIEGAVIALAVVALWQLLDPADDGQLGLLVTPLLALVLGIVLARLMAVVAARRLTAATRRGSIADMVAMAQLSRRGESRRIVLLITVAVALLAFGVCAWDIADRNRHVVAADTVGAHTVYRLTASDPARMIAAVERLDPEGRSLMAVVRSFERYRSSDFTVIAAQADRLGVADWRGIDGTTFAAALAPEALTALTVTDRIRVDLSDVTVDAARTPQLIARVVDGRGQPVTVRLGELHDDARTFRADLPGCSGGCRLLGVGVARYPGDLQTVHFDITVDAIADGNGTVADLGDCTGWSRPWHVPAATAFDVSCDDGLRLTAATVDAKDLVAEHSTAPMVLPVVLAGPQPSSDIADGFTFPAPHGDVAHFRAAATVDVVPRGGVRAMIVDLAYANRMAESVTSLADRPELSYEIWAAAGAPDNMVSRLAAEGLFVSSSDTRAHEALRLSRAAPALALNLYLVAASAALILVAGAMLMAATSAASSRGGDLAALSVAGVPPSTLRSAPVREQLYWMIVPTLAGAAGGLVGLALVLPRVPIVTTAPLLAPVDYGLGLWWPLGAGVVALVALSAVTAIAVRTQVRHGDPAALRRAGE